MNNHTATTPLVYIISFVCFLGLSFDAAATEPEEELRLDDEKPSDLNDEEAEEEPSLELNEDETNEEQEKWTYQFLTTEEYRFGYSSQPKGTSTVSNSASPITEGRARYDHELRLFTNQTLISPKEHFQAELSGVLFADMGKQQDTPVVSPHNSIFENHGYRMWFDLYTLSAEFKSEDTIAYVRGGRQISEHGPDILFDGIASKLRLANPYLDLFVFGGRTVHFFKLDKGLFEDWVASGGLVVRPAPFLKFELYYRFVAEDTKQEQRLLENGYGIAGWLQASDIFFLHVYYRGIDKKPAHAGGSINLEWASIGLGISVGTDTQLVALKRISESQNPYFTILGESLPYFMAYANLWKSFTTDTGIYSLTVGWSGRILTKDEPTFFNRDYGRAYLWFQVTDFFVPGLFWGITGEFHYNLGADKKIFEPSFALGGSVGYDNKSIRAEMGTYYQRYKYDYYADLSEINDVRTVFGGLSYSPIEWFEMGVKYELEIYDRYAHRATVSLTQRF